MAILDALADAPLGHWGLTVFSLTARRGRVA
jgi:hypothetical protein